MSAVLDRSPAPWDTDPCVAGSAASTPPRRFAALNEHLGGVALEGVNDGQRDAITAPLDRNVRVVAGAGTGKTTALTRRIVWLIANGVAPFRIMAATFTNKATNEMRERLTRMLGEATAKVVRITTLHSFAWRIVSTYFADLGFDVRPTPMDENESERSIRRMWMGHESSRTARTETKLFGLRLELEEIEAGMTRYGPEEVASRMEALQKRIAMGEDILVDARKQDRQRASMALSIIERMSTQGFWPASQVEPCRVAEFLIDEHERDAFGPVDEDGGEKLWDKTLHFIAMCDAWEAYKKRHNLIDFADMVLLAKHLLSARADLLEVWRQKFDHILLDEFQDLNNEQFILVRLLTSGPIPARVFAVGDQDQSVYGFRGANCALMSEPMDRYYHPVTVKLVRNYRSRPEIIAASNGLIEHNVSRIKKTLEPVKPAGGIITAVSHPDDEHQIAAVTAAVRRAIEVDRVSPSEIAILARRNSDLKPYASALVVAGVPHRIVGAAKFFETPWVKEAMAWAMLVLRPTHIDAARIASSAPAMGLGPGAIAKLELEASMAGVGLADLIRDQRAAADAAPQTGKKKGSKVGPGKGALAFLDRYEACAKAYGDGGVTALFDAIVRGSTGGYPSMIAWNNDLKARGPRAAGDMNTLLDLVQRMDVDLRRDAPLMDEEGRPIEPLEEFFSRVRLQAGDIAIGAEESAEGESAPAVSLMTIHRAKGLEFEVVCLVQCEDLGLRDPVHLPFNRSSPGADAVGAEGDMSSGGPEEDRRVAYVAITRAKRVLNVTMSRVRTINGMTQACAWTNFIGEMPGVLEREIRA